LRRPAGPGENRFFNVFFTLRQGLWLFVKQAGGVNIMASQSLYRKWRSQTFDEMVGQEHIIRTLKNALANNTLVHAYLFTGPRGTGKTSTARLLAKTVNCPNFKDGEPCNECQQCREITAGNSFNVIEIDAASNRGIDSIRELREKVMMPPATGKYKIYILDEAHMLTTEAFNALLKTLEEPPDYAIFVLATTDVHKMLPTVISRCQRCDFKRISTRQIVNHLLFVAKEEAVELERSAAELIARTAAGGMRDALSLLDQAIAYAGNVISLAQVQSMLGVADPRAISKLITYIAGLDSPALLYLLHELSEAGADLRQINSQVVEFWRALMLAKAGADVATILDLTEDEVNEVQQLMPAFALEELTECARIFAQNELVQKNQGSPQLGLELASLECVELHRRVQAGGTVMKETSMPQATAAALVRAPASSAIAPEAAARPAPLRSAHEPESTLARQNEAFTPPAASPARNQHIREESAAPAVPVQMRTGQHSLTLQKVVASWENVKKRTMQKSNLLGTYVGMCDVVGIENDDEHIFIVIRAAKPAHFKALKEGDRPKDVEWALSTEFSMPCKVRIIPPDQAYAGSRAQNSTGVMTSPPQSAYREPVRQTFEPPAEKSLEMPPPAAAPRLPEPLPERTQQESRVSERLPEYDLQAQTLARQQGVRENKKAALSKEELGQKVQQDPVVQEFVKMFRATIADIQPK
jgi:DNA polymerase-3 subunit gamma/tau